MQRKKISLFFLCLFMFTCFPIIEVDADTSYLIKSPDSRACTIRTEPNEGGNWLVQGSLHYLDTGDKVTVISDEKPTASTNEKCSSEYYPVLVSGLKGYVCGDYIAFETNGKYDEEWEALKYPKSYWPYLNILKEKYPNWTFTPIFLEVDWKNAVAAESKVGVSLINTRNQGWLSTDDISYDWNTDTFNDIFDGKGWYAANSDIISYYMDPRNFLNETNIFMFETLSSSDSHKIEVVRSILSGTFMSGDYTDPDGTVHNYAEVLMEIGKELNVSPYLLATRAKQEVVVSGNPSGSVSGTVSGYEGYYNFFNIGAYAQDDKDAITNGLIYAKSKGWDTRYKSIYGGAELIAKEYISIGQDTLYLQKWDMIGNLYTHQYMSNIEAPKSEATSIYKSYLSQNILNMDFTFHIPIYNNMPESTIIPDVGNPNNYLKSFTVNGKPLEGFDSKKTLYEVWVPENANIINFGGSPVSSKATVKGIGNHDITTNKQTFVITVTAQNGKKRDYSIIVNRPNSESVDLPSIANQLGYRLTGKYLTNLSFTTSVDTVKQKVDKLTNKVQVTIQDSNGNNVKERNFHTGDKIILENNGRKLEYTAVLYGDVNGDGAVDIIDLLLVQKIILNSTTLSEPYIRAANISGNRGAESVTVEEIDIVDLLLVQKNILGASTISQ